MVGKEKGFASRVRSDYPTVNTLHCIIHQTVLCANLSGKMKQTMDLVIKTVNHIRSTSSLQHRLFKMLLKEQDAEYADLLQHNDVRWLSRGRVLERFFALYKEVSEFLSGQKSAKSQELLAFIQDAEFISHLAFLCDITSHLNTLNLQLQGGGASVGELLHKVNAFQSELDVYLSDLKGRKLHFPSLRSVPAENAASLSAMVEVLKCLRENFKTRFEHFKIPSEVL